VEELAVNPDRLLPAPRYDVTRALPDRTQRPALLPAEPKRLAA
jgi:hypothetical protein